MNVIRGLLFDNLGLKLVALLLSVLVYLNVYTDRPAKEIVTFPLSLQDVPDSISLSGPVPSAFQAEIRGKGKQIIQLRITEPPLKVSLAGVGPGRFERAISASDLPLLEGLEVERLLGPRVLELELDRKLRRRLPVAPRVTGAPAAGYRADGGALVRPLTVLVTGPARVVARMDSVRLLPVSLDGRRDSVRVSVGAYMLPDWCTIEPEVVSVTLRLRRTTP